MLKANGEVITGAKARCGQKWCPHCGRKYQQRIYACIEKRVGALPSDQPRMVTLTMRLPPGLYQGQLARNIQTVADVQRRTHQRLRDQEHACRMLDKYRQSGDVERARYWENARLERLPLPTNNGEYVYARTWQKGVGYCAPTMGRTTYIWAREITTGSTGERWHVHLHYLVPSRADAERLIAAWDAEAPQRDATQCMVSECVSAEYAKASPARYMTKYVTKSTLKLSQEGYREYMRATKGRRQYDAAGFWRPLGVGGRDRPEDQRVVAVWRVSVKVDHLTGEVTTEQNWHDAASFFAADHVWRQWAVLQKHIRRRRLGRLNQYGTMLREPEANGACSDVVGYEGSRADLDALELALLEAPWHYHDSQLAN